MAEANTPQLQGATREYSMYDETISLLSLARQPVINQTGCGWSHLESVSAKGTRMKPERQFSKMFGALSVLVLAALTIAACSSAGVTAQLNDGTLTICHATGDTTVPYEEITLGFDELITHVAHEGDIVPAPAEGCPTTVEMGDNDGKLTICHATGSATNPYNEITVDFNGLRGHSNHAGDIIPAPEEGCPPIVPTPGPSPTLTADKVTICHATGSSKNPYVMITVSVNGLNGHDKHSGDIIPAPAGGCP
jgi:hypothetical protein